MRKTALAVLTLAALWTAAPIWTATPARAQTYDPAYPVCLHLFGKEVEYYECTYTSLEQCNQSASMRQAMCVINPYYAGRETVGRNSARQRRTY